MSLVFILGFTCTMGLILLTCSLFLLVSGLHFIACSSIDTPLYWLDPWPAFYHCLLCPRGFLAKSSRTYVDFWPKVVYTRRFYTKILLSMQVFGQKSRIWAFPCGFLAKSRVYVLFHAGFGPKVAYILRCGEFDVGGSCWVGCECGWVFLGSDVVCWMPLL